MTQAWCFSLKPAFTITPGNAVRRGAETAVLCLKGQRKAKKYVQDYVVAVAPMPDGGPSLDFIDPETELADGGAPLHFVPGVATAGEAGAQPHPQPGDLMRNEMGLWLAVWETDGIYRFVSFIDVANGTVRRLRKGAIGTLYRDWHVDGPVAS